MKKQNRIFLAVLGVLVVVGIVFSMSSFGLLQGKIFRASRYKVKNLHVSTYENNVGLLWDSPKGKALSSNGYAVMMKEGSDFTAGDLAIGITPIYVPLDETQYTFKDLENSPCYFKVGIGRYVDGKWLTYGNYSDTVSFSF